ncbi:MAG: LuxR C-terminal-related transcriptional regulator [Enterobacterales bacterium]|nr:LuxR C-terminal-related transcriptional regulator [Enterobacterales bacterium]
MKDHFITTALVIIMVLNCFDVITDIHLGVPLWHILEESAIVLLSAVGAGYLIYENHHRSKRLAHLAETLFESNKRVDNITEKMRMERKHYSQVIHQQFDDWQLTSGEQQVGMLLLKGLSFKEIAAVRNTKEKTVRQQASTIYSKSNLEGRHEFSAWFLEDFLS